MLKDFDQVLRAESIGVIQKNVEPMVCLRSVHLSVSYGESGASSGLKFRVFEEGTQLQPPWNRNVRIF